MTIRLYGRQQGHGSHAQVTDGFRGALQRAGKNVSFYPLDVELDGAVPGAFARHGIFTGALGEVVQMTRNARHERRWVMVAPNSNYFPETLKRAISDIATDILVPSNWAAAMMSHVFMGRTIRTVPHGISSEFKSSETRVGYGNKFVVLHFSSSDRERKGTFELIQAWKILKDRGKLENHMLCCVLDEPARNQIVNRLLEEDLGVTGTQLALVSRVDLDPNGIAHMYQRAHLICQPSRGEAFGLCPLEALACGTPVVVTTVTGHSEWAFLDETLVVRDRSGCFYRSRHGAELRLRPGIVPIATGADAPIDDGPGAMAPQLDPEAIADALEQAIVTWPTLSKEAMAAAPALSTEWSWDTQLKSWLNDLGE